MRADRRDINERKIVDFWKALGYEWIAAKPGQGFDGLLVTRLDVHIVEIKNPQRKWKLTDCERECKEAVERLGQQYHIVETMEDAEILAGVMGDAGAPQCRCFLIERANGER